MWIPPENEAAIIKGFLSFAVSIQLIFFPRNFLVFSFLLYARTRKFAFFDHISASVYSDS